MADILIIDDEENIAFSLQLALTRSGHACRVAVTGSAALSECSRHVPDLALLDIHLPDMSGLELLPRLRATYADLGVIILTAFGTVSSAVEAMKHGALDYIQKPLAIDGVLLAVERSLEARRLRSRLTAYEDAQRREGGAVEVIGNSPQIGEVLSMARRIAALPDDVDSRLTTVLLTGETGTGKEVIARHIHAHSPRAGRPFIHLNCTAIPQNLFESELFGHEAGSFTDARTSKKGLLETAHEGTLFLDEIGDIPLTAQAKLLTVIESGRFRRLGGTTERLANVRVTAATNSPLARRVRDGQFREDLYYRLNAFHIELPPLRTRGDDLLLLSDHFLSEFCRKLHRPVATLSPEALAVLRVYPWPGNVRELANVLQRAVLLSDTPVLSAAALGLPTRELEPVTRPEPDAPDSVRVEFDFARQDCTLQAVERRLLTAALEHSRGNISQAARLLGLTRGSLRHRLEKLHIPIPP